MIERIEDLVRPNGRDLDDEQLLVVATQIAARPDLWSEEVQHDPTQRTFRQLLRDEHLDVWLLCWSHDHDTGFHDHDLSAGAVAVVAGSVREERLVLGRPVDAPIARTVHAGSSFGFGASDIHRVLHAGTEPAVTIHAYSPPLVRMGSYTIESSGQLRRHAVSHEEELRPLTDGGAGDRPAQLAEGTAQEPSISRRTSLATLNASRAAGTPQ